MDPNSMAALSAAGINPGNAVGASGPATDYDRSLTYVVDGLNYSLGNGGNPLANKEGRSILSVGTSLFGKKETQDFLDSIAIFNQRPDIQQMSPEQRIDTYFNLNHDNENVSHIMGKLKNIGYDPKQRYWDTPNVDVRRQASAAAASQVTAKK